MRPQFPISAQDEQLLYQRLRDGDPTASADLVNIFLGPLTQWLRGQQGRPADDLPLEAAEDALISLIKSPMSFDPAKGIRLYSYLRMSARGDLRNIYRREHRQIGRMRSLESVELLPQAGKYLGRTDDPASRLIASESIAEFSGKVAVAQDGLTDSELRALQLMIEGERKTVRFAEALGIADLPPNEQRAEVKRVKDKLKKRMERSGRANDDTP